MKLCDHYRDKYSCLTCPYEDGKQPCFTPHRRPSPQSEAEREARKREYKRRWMEKKRRRQLEAEFPYLFRGK